MNTTCNFAHEQSAISSESANQWTHALGWGLSVIGATLLVRAVADCGDAWRACGCVVYAAALVGVYAASTLSHAVTDHMWRNRFRMLDQICIFLLVVGTYTAYAATYARDGWLGSMLAAMWMIALLGIVARIRSGNESVSFTWYVALGWIPILALGRILDTTGLAGTVLAFGGGVVYTAGTWFLVNDHKHPHFHAVWHCFTMLGSMIHFVYVYQYVAMLPGT